MSWFRVDDTFHSHPKADAAGVEAIGLWVLAGSFASSYRPDGVVTKRDVVRLAGKRGPQLATKLTHAGLWHEVDGGWMFHDWHDYRDGGEAELLRRKAANAERMARHRAKQKANGDVTGDATGDVTEKRHSDATECAPPVPSRPDHPVHSECAHEPGDFPTIWRTYAKAVEIGVGRAVETGKWASTVEQDSLAWTWRHESAAGVAWDAFPTVLTGLVRSWVTQTLSAGEERFTGGWRPSKYAEWRRSAKLEAAPPEYTDEQIAGGVVYDS